VPDPHEACDAVPVCETGGPYAQACGNVVNLDGSASVDPDGMPLTYTWTTDCPGTLTGADTATPTLTLDSCGMSCNINLLVFDGYWTSECSSTVTATDMEPPTVTAVLRPTSPLPPASARSVCAPRTSREVLVECSSTDNCAVTAESVEIVLTNYNVPDAGGPCFVQTDVYPATCGQVVEISLPSPPCPATPPASPAPPIQVRSNRPVLLTAADAVLVVTATDACNNVGTGTFNPEVEPSPLCDEVLQDGTCCPAIGNAPDVSCCVWVCGRTTPPGSDLQETPAEVAKTEESVGGGERSR
jgi:hypothetical protein